MGKDVVGSGGLRKIAKLRVLRGLFDILIYVQQDVTLRSLFYLETAVHVSGGTTTHHQEHKQLYLQHLVFVTPLLLPATVMEELELQFQLFHDSGR
jgi:hypothetical protein